jgi:mono/diheme cytochrome c family protein
MTRALGPKLLLLAALTATAACDMFAARSPGEKLWRARCADCHGLDGRGNTPRYMGESYADLTDDSWRTSGDENTIGDVIRQGVFGKMPANADLSDEQVAELISWLRYLRGEESSPDS